MESQISHWADTIAEATNQRGFIFFVCSLVIGACLTLVGQGHVQKRSIPNERLSQGRYQQREESAKRRTRDVIRLPGPVLPVRTTQNLPVAKEQPHPSRHGTKILPPYRNVIGLSLVKDKSLSPRQVALLTEMGVPVEWMG